MYILWPTFNVATPYTDTLLATSCHKSRQISSHSLRSILASWRTTTRHATCIIPFFQSPRSTSDRISRQPSICTSRTYLSFTSSANIVPSALDGASNSLCVRCTHIISHSVWTIVTPTHPTTDWRRPNGYQPERDVHTTSSSVVLTISAQ